MKLRSRLASISLSLLLPAAPAYTAENGSAHYPTGTNTIVPALMPAPDTSLWLNYITYYTADRFNNSNGDSAVPNYQVNAVAEAARLLHTWPAMGGVSWTSGIVLIANHASIAIRNQTLVHDLQREATERHHQALHDALTGLNNRAVFRDQLVRASASVRGRKVSRSPFVRARFPSHS